MVKSGGGVLIVATAQLVVGLCLLGIYEGYKKYYYAKFLSDEAPAAGATTTAADTRVAAYESPLDFSSPMGFIYWASILINVFAVFGLAGVLSAQRELILAFFGFNVVSMVASFHGFVDLCTDASVRYPGEPLKLTAYESAAATFMFFNFALSVAATFFAVKAVDEIKLKSREELNRFAVLSDTLAYEADMP